MSLFLTALKRLKDEDNEEGKKKEEEEEVDDVIVVGVSDAVLDTVKRLKCKARARNFYISGVVVEKRMAKLNAETKKFIEHRTQKNCEKEKSSYKTFSKRKQWRRERRKSVR